MRILLLIILFVLSSCWNKLPDGREYKLIETCLQWHLSPSVQHYDVGKCTGCGTYIIMQHVCDVTRYDTAWRGANNISIGVIQ